MVPLWFVVREPDVQIGRIVGTVCREWIIHRALFAVWLKEARRPSARAFAPNKKGGLPGRP